MSEIRLMLGSNETNLLHAMLTDHVAKLEKDINLGELSRTEQLWYEDQVTVCTNMLSKLDSEIAEFNKKAAE